MTDIPKQEKSNNLLCMPKKTLIMDQVIAWIKEYGIEDENLFLRRFPGLDFKKIKFKWIHVWDPSLVKNKWTSADDLRIFLNFVQFGRSWKKIANVFKNRSRIAIRNRFVNSFKIRLIMENIHLFEKLILDFELEDKGRSPLENSDTFFYFFTYLY